MAQAILLESVDSLGEPGDVVDVSDGYLRNFLLPRNLAQRATKGLIEEASRRREMAEQIARETLEKAGETVALLNRTVLTIPHRAGEDGKLFGSVTSAEIADAVKQARGLHLDKRKIRLEQPIRTTGTFMVEVEIAPDAVATIKTIVAGA